MSCLAHGLNSKTLSISEELDWLTWKQILVLLRLMFDPATERGTAHKHTSIS
jgi:hypothetical protein